MANPIVKLLLKVLKVYDISIPTQSIAKTVLTHPDYPSVLCISDSLDRWRVKHVVFKPSLKKLYKLNIPVIAHLKRGEHVWVTQITDSKVYYWSAVDNKHVITYADFEQIWSGVALAFEDINNAGEPDYAQKRRKEITEKIFRYGIASISTLLWALLMYISWTNDAQLPIIPKVCLLFTNVAGLYLSYILIKQEKRQFNRLVDKFCKSGKHIDCNQITSSRYSKFFGWISWAELGIAYFAATLLWITIAPLSYDWLSPLCWLTLVTLPFTLWSIFVQAFIIRKWCLFCSSVVILLWTNATILYGHISRNLGLHVPEIALLLLLFLTCVALVSYIHNANGEKERLYASRREVARIKYDSRTLQSQLSEKEYLTSDVGFTWGNSQSTYEVTLYVSKACSHCSKAIKEMKQLTDIYPSIGYRLIFAAHPEMDDDSKHIIRHFISLNRVMDKNDFFIMLDTWYTMPDKNWKTLQQTYPVVPVDDNERELEVLYQFNQQAVLDHTPAILVNGKLLLSEQYSYADLLGITRTLNAEG